MPENLFRGLFDAADSNVISPEQFLLCLAVSLFIGLVLSRMAGWKHDDSRSFSMTLVLIPAAVCVVIMMVNGNVGTGVAVAGAFSLVRFRSAPGTGREICAIFIAMVSGLMAGMGYLAYSVLFTGILGGMMMLFTADTLQKNGPCRELRITIPENLNYTELFTPVLNACTVTHTLKQVRTTNMGSMFRLTYDVRLKPDICEKDMIDELRCLNGNLEISLNYPESESIRL